MVSTAVAVTILLILLTSYRTRSVSVKGHARARILAVAAIATITDRHSPVSFDRSIARSLDRKPRTFPSPYNELS